MNKEIPLFCPNCRSSKMRYNLDTKMITCLKCGFSNNKIKRKNGERE